MSFALPSRQTLNPLAGVALLACGNIATIYGAWQLRDAFGSPFSSPLANAAMPFGLLALPLFALYAFFEFRGFRLSRLVNLPVAPKESPLLSSVAFAVLGAGWVFVKGGVSFSTAAKAEHAAHPEIPPAHNPAPGREFIETVVFVIVLVAMLNLFVVQAFVIPTGSMAETLFGYKKMITCPECGFEFPVNASQEVEPQSGRPQQRINGYCCPNCRYDNPTGAADVTPTSGDRVLVAKFLPMNSRGEVVVFKFPDAPQTGQVAQNYIKRLVGFGGETVGVFGGDLYVTRALTYPADAVDEDGQPLYPRPKDPNDLWRAPFIDRWTGPDYGYANAAAALALFDKSRANSFTLGGDGFEIVRKPDDQVMSMRRIVYDNDHQSKNLVKAHAPRRWQPDPDAGSGWAADDPNAPKAFAHTGADFGWVRYLHLMPAAARDDSRPGWKSPATDVQLMPRKITNFMGYNAGHQGNAGQENLDNSDHWVGDLILECRAKAVADAAVVLELNKGEYRYRAEFADGQVRLKMFPAEEEYTRPDGNKSTRLRDVPVGDDPFTLTTAAADIRGGVHHLRFANVDCRLRVWVDDKPIDFGGKADYAPPPPPPAAADDPPGEGWTRWDVERPVCVGASGTAGVDQLKVWRDTYYIQNRGPANNRPTAGRNDVSTYYVHPGHYLCMGDNSSQSSDGRMWGLVPERLMLGRAVLIFFPFDRIGFIE